MRTHYPRQADGAFFYAVRRRYKRLPISASGRANITRFPRKISTKSATALSDVHFARMFRQSMNRAPHQYVMQRRMALAQQLVCYSSRSLSDIAMACGFRGPLGKRKISYVKLVFCTDCYLLSVTNGIFPVPA